MFSEDVSAASWVPFTVSFWPKLRCTVTASLLPVKSKPAFVSAVSFSFNCFRLTASASFTPSFTLVMFWLPALMPLVLSITALPTVTLSKVTSLAVLIVKVLSFLVILMFWPSRNFTVSPAFTGLVCSLFEVTFQNALLIAFATDCAVAGAAEGAAAWPLESTVISAVVTSTFRIFLPLASLRLLATVLLPFSISTKPVITSLPLGVMLLKFLSAALSILALVSASISTVTSAPEAFVVKPLAPFTLNCKPSCLFNVCASVVPVLPPNLMVLLPRAFNWDTFTASLSATPFATPAIFLSFKVIPSAPKAIVVPAPETLVISARVGETENLKSLADWSITIFFPAFNFTRSFGLTFSVAGLLAVPSAASEVIFQPAVAISATV